MLANKQVKSLASDSNKVLTSTRGKYSDYSPKERAQIGRYAAENGLTKAAKHFMEQLNRNVPVSTAKRLNSEYLKKLGEIQNLGFGEDKHTPFASRINNEPVFH